MAIFTPTLTQGSDFQPSDPVKYATLKFDDMRPEEGVDGVTAIEQAVYEMLIEQQVSHAWGVCRLYQSENPSFYEWLQARDAEGIEIWHHGNRHDRIDGESWEFKNRDEASQREHLHYTQAKIYAKTGIILRTFGAPYNRTDAATGRVLNAMPDIQTMYFSKGSPNFEGRVLNDRVNLETKTGVVSTLEAFKTSYASKRDATIVVLQGHPVYWEADRDLKRLQSIVDFLKSEGRVFVTPTEYYRLQEDLPAKNSGADSAEG